MGAESEFPQATDYVVVDIAGGSDSEVGIKTLTVDITSGRMWRLILRQAT